MHILFYIIAFLYKQKSLAYMWYLVGLPSGKVLETYLKKELYV